MHVIHSTACIMFLEGVSMGVNIVVVCMEVVHAV